MRLSLPAPPLKISASVPPEMASLPAPPEIVLAIFDPVMVSFPAVPLIVTVSVPLVKVPAVMFVNVVVSPDPTLMIRPDVPVELSLSMIVSAVSCAPVKVAV